MKCCSRTSSRTYLRRQDACASAVDGLTMIGDKEEFTASANSRMVTVLQTK